MPMNIDQQVALMREKGFVFDEHYKIRGIMANDADIERLAYDAAMVYHCGVVGQTLNVGVVSHNATNFIMFIKYKTFFAHKCYLLVNVHWHLYCSPFFLFLRSN